MEINIAEKLRKKVEKKVKAWKGIWLRKDKKKKIYIKDKIREKREKIKIKVRN